MAAFTTESAVRLKFQLTDTVLAPSALILAGIEDAHAELVRFLNSVYGGGTPEEGLVLGETLLAGSRIYQSLAAKDAFDQKQAVIGHQQVGTGRRLDALLTVARLAEEAGWHILEPYLTSRPSSLHVGLTDTVPVLGN